MVYVNFLSQLFVYDEQPIPMSIKSIFCSHIPFKFWKIPTEDTSTQADPKSLQPKATAAGPASIQWLPLELINHITTYLQPSSDLALRHTNGWFNENAGRETSLVISDRVSNSLQYRLEYLCFLERDAESPRRQFVCSVCVQLHAADRFSKIELRKGPESRTCQRVWICEHRTLSLAGYRKVPNAPVRVNRLVRYPSFQNPNMVRNTYWDHCCTTVWTHRCFGCVNEKDGRTRMMASQWAIPLRDMMNFGML